MGLVREMNIEEDLAEVHQQEVTKVMESSPLMSHLAATERTMDKYQPFFSTTGPMSETLLTGQLGLMVTTATQNFNKRKCKTPYGHRLDIDIVWTWTSSARIGK